MKVFIINHSVCMCAYMCVTTLSQRLQDSRYPDGDGKKMMRKARNTKILVQKCIIKKVWRFGCALPSRNADICRKVKEIN